MGILQGKIVKKDDEKLKKQLEIQSYPWLNFREEGLVFPDNPRKSVILQKYHDPKEINEKVTVPSNFKELLEKKSSPLYPADLTADYEAGIRELLKRKRRRMLGEEEAMALELAELDAAVIEKKFREKPNKSSPRGGAMASPTAKPMQPPQDIPIHSHADEDTHSIVENTSVVENSSSIISEESSPPSAQNNMADLTKKAYEEAFTQGLTEGKIEGLKQGQEQGFQQGKEEGYSQGLKQGEERGYLEGFQNGEERALKAQESKYEMVFKNVALVIEQLESLKGSLYAQSREVFIEILKLCAEKILREQIKFTDKSLFSLFDKAVESASQKGNLSIELGAHDLPRMKRHIEQLGIQNKVTLKENPNKESGDFTIESDRGLSIVELKKSVNNFVEKIKAELYDDNPSPDIKAS